MSLSVLRGSSRDDHLQDVARNLDPPLRRGVLRVARWEPGTEGAARLRGRAHLVRSPRYTAMQDNDLRGFLDGGFYCGWNQPGQVHVRLGRVSDRRHGEPKYGESELFRVLHRWDRVDLPEDVRIRRARLRLWVEEPPRACVRVVLYEAKKDWVPGQGGIERNNVSVPKRGEVWWNEAEHDVRRWTLPGAGFASHEDPAADTDAFPLAEAVCRADTRKIVLGSGPLAAYVQRRIRAREPILLLLKLSDFAEDVPGTLLSLFAADFGDSWTASWRPRLELDWELSVDDVVEEPVCLEYGRACEWSVAARPGELYVVDVRRERGSPAPRLAVVAGAKTTGDLPARWPTVVRATGRRLTFRLLAVGDALPLGTAFEAQLRDTWVVTGPPEDQSIQWRFTAPSGHRHEVTGTYRGDWTWQVSFTPDELGPWRYRWRHRLVPEGRTSPPGRFDVVAWRAREVLDGLEGFSGRSGRGGTRRTAPDRTRQRVAFARLQRAAMSLTSGAEGRRRPPAEVRLALRRAREALWGRPVPDPYPLKSQPMRRAFRGRDLRDPFPRVPGLALTWPERVGRIARPWGRALRRIRRLGSKHGIGRHSRAAGGR